MKIEACLIINTYSFMLKSFFINMYLYVYGKLILILVCRFLMMDLIKFETTVKTEMFFYDFMNPNKTSHLINKKSGGGDRKLWFLKSQSKIMSTRI